MSSSVGAVILDMDGVMLDTESIYKPAWQQAAKEYGYSLDDAFYLTLVGRDTASCELALLERLGSDFPVADFRTRWSLLWRTAVEHSGISTKPGLTELLSILDASQVPVAVATSSDREYTTLSLRAARLENRFQHIVTRDEVVSGKPVPDVYLESARRLGVAPERCIAVEDSDAGVLAASRAGMVTVMVPDVKRPSPEAQTAAFHVATSLFDARSVIASLLRGA
jgi:HAD superfamily hydrolase (TIGR01509 family)